ncbi:PREDICTED: tRNA (adenine(58)-N(1))-methyltransferase non-catalytic subunit TRM6 [Polistes canadensis]|uniref:tRNA (adenine(58)-N(1))-methyltransferase non-catalytic subunit TRM6 n=1 Tax=Polistes canadensis TaxID=91411 RepID=UPI000718F708|nr:PREDICTED: tRNA (adenine(58)-N(1))-methyltransferase non-catalytic subunit TRM6 [Polistes canadensis]
MSEVEDDIKAGNYVIVKKQKYTKLYKVSNKGILMLGKDEINMEEIIGKPYWTTFEMVPSKNNKRSYTLKVIKGAESWNDLKNNSSSGLDNRCITNDGTSQKLSKEEILELQESGKSGKEIVGTLIENSRSFSAKTEYSQEKYIKKKEQKYFRYLTICKPTIMSLHEVYFRQDHARLGGLRMDALSQLLSYSDVQSDGLYMLYDSGSLGLPSAAMLHRIGANTTGLLINLHPGNIPQLTIIQAMNFPKEQLERHLTVNIYSFIRLYNQGESLSSDDVSLCRTVSDSNTSQSGNNEVLLSSSNDYRKETEVENDKEVLKIDQIIDSNINETINNGSISLDAMQAETNPTIENVTNTDELMKEEKVENKNTLKRKLNDHIENEPVKKPKWLIETQFILDLLKNSKARSLVIVAKEHPLEIVKFLLPFLGASRPFVIFHTHREPLQETYMALKQTQNVVNLRLFSNFLRSYQILQDRTHPDILTSDTGGYILTGYLVE